MLLKSLSYMCYLNVSVTLNLVFASSVSVSAVFHPIPLMFPHPTQFLACLAAVLSTVYLCYLFRPSLAFQGHTAFDVTFLWNADRNNLFCQHASFPSGPAPGVGVNGIGILFISGNAGLPCSVFCTISLLKKKHAIKRMY